MPKLMPSRLSFGRMLIAGSIKAASSILLLLIAVLSAQAAPATHWYVDPVAGDNENDCQSTASACRIIIDGEHAGRILYMATDTTISGATIRHGQIVTPSSNIFDTGGGGRSIWQQNTKCERADFGER